MEIEGIVAMVGLLCGHPGVDISENRLATRNLLLEKQTELLALVKKNVLASDIKPSEKLPVTRNSWQWFQLQALTVSKMQAVHLISWFCGHYRVIL